MSQSEGGVTDELAMKLDRRIAINENDPTVEKKTTVFNPNTEFKCFTRKQLKDLDKIFKTMDEKELQDLEKVFNELFDVNNDKFLDLMEMKVLMEKLGAPQTHLGLKAMISEVDEDHDGKISYREFLLIYKKAQDGELVCEGLKQLTLLSEVDVSEVGVSGAKDFFEAKMKEISNQSKFEADIRAEQEDRKREAEEAAARKREFQKKKQMFGVNTE